MYPLTQLPQITMDATNNSSYANSTDKYRCPFNDDYKYVLLPLGYGLVFVIGLVLNIIAMYIILFRIKHWSPNTIYMINLTICDTLYILTLPFLIFYYLDKNVRWPFGELFCRFLRFLFYTNLYASILFLSCISLHRFLGICHPVRSLHWVSPRRAWLVSAGVWGTVLVAQAPILYFARLKVTGNRQICHDTTSEPLFPYFFIYSSVVSVLFFMLPFIVVLVCYTMMLRNLLQPSLMGGNTSQRSKQKSVKMIIIILLAFMLCFLPYHLTRSLYYSFRQLQVNCSLLEGSSIAYKVMRPVASVNSCLDPILYFLSGQRFRRTLKKKGKQGQRSQNSEEPSTQEKLVQTSGM